MIMMAATLIMCFAFSLSVMAAPSPEDEYYNTSTEQEKVDEKTVKTIPVYNDLLSRQMWIQIAALPVKLLGELKYIFAVTDVTQDRQNTGKFKCRGCRCRTCQCI